MENINYNNRSGRVLSGLIVVLIGVAFLLNNMGFNFPSWFFRWHTLLIVIGLIIGVKRNFRGARWLIVLLIGVYFTIGDIPGLDFDATDYALGVGLVILGVYLIFKPKRNSDLNNRFSERFGAARQQEGNAVPLDNQDVIDIVAVFAGNHQVVYSKSFRGGSAVAVFGGADINLVQADFEDTIVIDVTAVFGGIKLIVPQNWEVKSNITPIFGGLDDKRVPFVPDGEKRKILVIQGLALFGGVEIKNY